MSFNYAKIQAVVDTVLPKFGAVTTIRQGGGMTGPAHLRVPATPVDTETVGVDSQMTMAEARSDTPSTQRAVFVSGTLAVIPKKGDLVAFNMTAAEADAAEAAGSVAWLKVDQTITHGPGGVPLLYELKLES